MAYNTKKRKQLHISAADTNTASDTNAVQEVQTNANLSATDVGNATTTNEQPNPKHCQRSQHRRWARSHNHKEWKVCC